MTDWTKDTGSGGTLMIRDTGSDVEFWFKAGYSNDWYNGLQFSYTANGSTTNKSINYPTGADWYKVGSVNVTYDQTVTFKLVSDTNIGGIGGPASFSHSIDRAAKPSPPSTPKISGIKSTSVVASFTDGANGGDAIDSRHLGYGKSSSYPDTVINSDGSTTISGLDPGTTYYFWAQTHNSEGWSSWSGRASAKTLDVPDTMPSPLLSSVTMTSVDVAFSPNGNGGSAITAYQIGIGDGFHNVNTTISARSPQVVTGLTPGTTYYIFVRAQNSVGWSAWSLPTVIKTISGAYVKVGSTWKLAVPYVNVGGTWKLAEPWVRNVGVWKRTT